MRSFKRPTLVALLILLANIGLWAFVNRGVVQRAWGGQISCLSYSAYQADHPDERYSDAKIEADLEAMSRLTGCIRTYGVSDGLDRIVPIAARHKLNVMLGGWLSPDKAANLKEIDRVVALAKENTNVSRLLIGNETLLREDVKIDEMLSLIDRAKRQVNIPVSTAEPWHIWLKYPELVQAVDFITVHILPYWEGLPIDGAMDYVTFRWDQLANAFPDKHVLIGEIGWPSEGQWDRASEPSLVNQARFIRDFLNLATQRRFDYSLMEGIDAPWKRRIEGTVGAHWGLLDKDLKPKFAMSGTVFESSGWIWGCLVASLMAMPGIIWFVRRRADLKPAGQIFYAGLIQSVCSLLIWASMTAVDEKIISANTLSWVVLIGAQIVLLALLLVDGFELTEVVWANRRRYFAPLDAPLPPDAPKVSIHVPCYNEPPQMVIETLNALAALDYPNFEVLVIDNNTKDDEVWKPLEAHCAKLGSRFRFFHLPKWPGYKAGALNFALTQTAKDVEVVGVIDSDYVVTPNWLKATVPYFSKTEVAIVQAPQDYRDGDESMFKRMCYWEYAGFFHIGMVQRNERNAIIQHGTMTLIRKTTLQSVDGWAEWCICEDAELGLRLFERGFEAVYLEHSLGRGLIPDTFSDYKTQRFRWAYGAVQIIKRHWRQLSDEGSLTRGQRYHFISGWLPWFADAAHLVFASAAIFWSILLLLKWVEFPPTVFLVPTLSVFVFKVAAGLWLYHARVACGWKDRIGAAIAGMGLTHAVGRAVWQGLFTSGKPFFRTPKCENQPAAIQGFLMAREEIGLLLSLWICAAAVLYRFEIENFNAQLWSGMLCVQTLPYMAAFAMSMINVRGKRRST